MSKVMKTVLGISVSVVIYLVLILGIKTFYPEPEYSDFCEDGQEYPYKICPLNESGERDPACLNQQEDEQQERQECYDQLSDARDIYERNLFIITAILGLLILVAAYFSMGMLNISAGLVMASIVLIIYGYIRGWRSADDRLKFAFALVDAAVIIGFAIYINKKKFK